MSKSANTIYRPLSRPGFQVIDRAHLMEESDLKYRTNNPTLMCEYERIPSGGLSELAYSRDPYLMIRTPLTKPDG